MTAGVVHSVVWVNGKRHADDALSLSACDRGLTLADGVFETMRARKGTIFRLGRHLARLERALTRLEIPSPPELHEWLARAVGSGSGEQTRIRLTVTRGAGPAGVDPPPDPRPTVVVSVGPMPSFPASIYTIGLTAHVASGRRNEFAMTAGVKTLAYVDAVAGMLEARRAGADEALFLDTEGHCSEASASNVFAWTGSSLVTPPLSCGVLAGITRETVLELARASGLSAEARPLGLDELLASEEVFLTSSLRGIAPVVRVGAQAIGRGAPGEVTRRLALDYLALVDRECGARP